jgi:hypothetical protein
MFHILLGALMSLYYLKRKAQRAALAEAEDNAYDGVPEVTAWPVGLEAPASRRPDPHAPESRWAGEGA